MPTAVRTQIHHFIKIEQSNIQPEKAEFLGGGGKNERREHPLLLYLESRPEYTFGEKKRTISKVTKKKMFFAIVERCATKKSEE